MAAERDYLAAARERVVLFDGAMGATLEQMALTPADYGGITTGTPHEVLVLHRPDVIEGVHASMLDAGAEVVETDTFQGSRLKLAEWGLAEHTVEINRRAAEIARAAAGPRRFVCGSIGPTGMLPSSDDPTLGAVTFAQLRETFAEQAGGLIEGGSDVLLVETAQDILEVKAAIFGIRDAFRTTGRRLPIQAQVSLLPESGTMLLGTDIAAVLAILSSLRVDVVGLNCSTGPEDMRSAIAYLGEHATMPVSCIPNAGIPHQGPRGETIFPEQPAQLAAALVEFVTRFDVGIVGGCCGSTPAHIAAIRARLDAAGRRPSTRPRTRLAPQLASMISATALVQEPGPTIVGERVNAQGSRKAKRLLLADDYEGLVRLAETQVEGGAHVLDLCVALTERADEADQMGRLVKDVAFRVDAPLQIDSTEPDVMRAALEQNPGRAVVNSVNLEAGRDKLDRVAPLVAEHGAALIALTIDEVGMAKTPERKLEITRRLHDLLCGEHGLDDEQLIVDALTFTLTTGDEEWRPSAVATIEGIRLIKAAFPRVLTSLGVSNVSFGVSPRSRKVLNSVFLHHCVEAGLDLAMVHPADVVPYGEIAPEVRELTDDLVLDRREDALARFIGHFEGTVGEDEVAEAADPTAEMSPQEALHWHILRRKRDGVEDQIDASVDQIGAVPTLNDVLLPAMKEVGDKFGAGELILPFVLQSAEVMKRAVARLERYLDRVEGYSKGTVVLATVFGDVHDIGKSLVNTILTNNGYRVVDLGKQVPVDRIIRAARDEHADAIGLSALLVSTSKQMPAAVGELHAQGLGFPLLVGGAAINRAFGRRIMFAEGPDSDTIYAPGVFYCKDAFEGLAVMDTLTDTDRRPALVAKVIDEAVAERAKPARREPETPAGAPSRSSVRTDVPVPAPPFWGVREVALDLADIRSHMDTRALFKLHWGGVKLKGEAYRRLVDDDFAPRLERMWAAQDYLAPRALYGYFPVAADGDELVFFDPDDPAVERERIGFPRQPARERLCLADYFRPLADTTPDTRDVAALQAVTVGPLATERTELLEREGEFSEQLFTHGLAVQSAEGMAEALHARVRSELGIEDGVGRRYSWGYPSCPDQSDHAQVFRLLVPERIGLTLTEAFALVPEQSTVAIVVSHPQAKYFSLRGGGGIAREHAATADESPEPALEA